MGELQLHERHSAVVSLKRVLRGEFEGFESLKVSKIRHCDASVPLFNSLFEHGF